MNWLLAIVRRFRCKHDWRPAMLHFVHALRVCDDCGKKDFLSYEQFYAQFGTPFQQVRANIYQRGEK